MQLGSGKRRSRAKFAFDVTHEFYHLCDKMFRHRHDVCSTDEDGKVFWRCLECFDSVGTSSRQLCRKDHCTKPPGWCCVCFSFFPEIDDKEIIPEKINAFLETNGWAGIRCNPHTVKIPKKISRALNEKKRVLFVDSEDDTLLYELQISPPKLFSCHSVWVNVPKREQQ